MKHIIWRSHSTGEIVEGILNVIKCSVENFQTISPVTGKRIVCILWTPWKIGNL